MRPQPARTEDRNASPLRAPLCFGFDSCNSLGSSAKALAAFLCCACRPRQPLTGPKRKENPMQAPRAFVLLVVAMALPFVMLSRAHAGSGEQARIAALERAVRALEAKVAALEKRNAFLSRHVRVSQDPMQGLNGPHIVFTGVNVHIQDGTGSTLSSGPSGLGNLVIGYNEQRATSTIPAVRTGAHNLVLGVGQGYGAVGGIVAGSHNDITGVFASVTGGSGNTARGSCSSVSGGSNNTASGEAASVSGGFDNTAAGRNASVTGGWRGSAGGQAATVSGGLYNHATGDASSVSGGNANTADGSYSSVSGGSNNTASGDESSVSGGFVNTASGTASSVSGGANREAPHQDSWAGGGLSQLQ